MDKEKISKKTKMSIELRLIIKSTDELYQIFEKIKSESGLRTNSEVIRFVLKQISKKPILYNNTKTETGA